MRWPSGDQAGEFWPRPGPFVSWAGPDPSAAASQTSVRSPERVDAKAMRLPSGEKRGWPSKKDEAT